MINNLKIKQLKISALTATIVIATILRLIALNQSLWLDEAINVIATRDRELTNLLFNYSIGDFHPPLFHAILWSWFKVFPASEIFARIPSVVFAVATVFLTYKISKTITGKKELKKLITKLAPLLLAISSLHIYYSQEARMYSLAAFATSLTFLRVIKLKKKASVKNKVLFLASCIFMMLSDYQPWLLLPFLFASVPGLTSLAVLFTLPWWPTLVQQLERGIATAKAVPLWGAIVGKLTLKSALLVPVKFLVGRTSIDNNLIFAAAIAIPLIVVLTALLKTTYTKTKEVRMLQGWLITPFIVSAVVAIKIPIFSYFRFLFVLPAFYLLIAIGLVKLSPIWKKAAIALVIITSLISTASYLGIRKFHRENWKEATAFIHQQSAQQSLVLFPNLAQAAGFEYYNAGRLPIQDRQTINLGSKTKDVFLVKYLSEIFDPNNKLTQTLKSNGFIPINQASFNGVLVWHYKLTSSNENSN